MGASISEFWKRWSAISWGVRSAVLFWKKGSVEVVGRWGGFWREEGVCESLRRVIGESL